MPEQPEKSWYERGKQDGQDEAQTRLAEACAHKGEALTRSEIRLLARSFFSEQWLHWIENALHQDWFSGWYPSFLLTCLKAEQAALQPIGDEPVAGCIRDWLLEQGASPELIQEANPALLFQVYHAQIACVDPIQFLEGIQDGQEAQQEDEDCPTASHLVCELIGDPGDAFLAERRSEDYLLGYLIGRMDVLFHDRSHSPLYAAATAGEYVDA